MPQPSAAGRMAAAPRAAAVRLALLRALLAALLAVLAPTLAPGPGGGGAAQAQALNLDYKALFGGGDSADGGGVPEAAPAREEPRGAARPARPPDLAAYGVLETYESESTMVRRTTQNVGIFRQRLERILRAAPTGFEAMARRLGEASPDGKPGYFVGVALVTFILILIGRAVVSLYAVYIARPIMVSAQRLGRPPAGISEKLPVLALRMVLTLLGAIIIASVVLALGLWLVEDHAPTQVTAGLLLAAYTLYLMVDTAWRMALSPYLSDYRIPRITDTQARRLYLWISGLAFFGIYSRAYVQWLREIGMNADIVALNAIIFGLLAMIFALALIWSNRPAITRAILRGRPREEASWIAGLGARLWAPAVSLYFIAAGAEETIRTILGLEKPVPLLAGAFITLMLALTVYAIGLYAVERIFARRPGPAPGDGAEPQTLAPDLAAPAAGLAAPRASAAPAASPAATAAAESEGPRRADGDMDGDGDGGEDGDEGGGGAPVPARAPAKERAAAPRRAAHGMVTFQDLATRVVSLFALGSGVYVLGLIWGGREIFAEGAVLDSLQDLVDTLFLGYVAYHAARIWLDRKIAEEGVDDIAAEPGDEGGGASAASRLGTLLPLFRSAILTAIAASVAVLAAMEFGINVAPLFAGAGIVGLAIGFGAQTLVRDILSGMFFLLDDAFRKGEYIDVGSVKGTVEKISLRSFQLRHHLGALHTIPFGEITHLTNFSRDWVMMKLPLRLTYDTDVEKVRKLVKKLGERLIQHPVEGPKFMQPLKSQGVYMMEDSAMIIRIKYMTRPGDQWTTRKLVYQEIRELFEREGVKFAHREVTVRLPDLRKGETLSDDEAAAVGAAARRTLDEPAAPGGGLAAAAEAR